MIVARSIFPSGGFCTIFRSRGYTGWGPNVFAFVKNETPYISAVFCSFNGEALGKKIPLLRSMDAMSHQAVWVLRLLGDHRIKRVVAQVGAGQEYFLVDEKLYRQREDLRLCACTLFGALSPRGQKSGSHYCGSIHPRAAAYMRELDGEL